MSLGVVVLLALAVSIDGFSAGFSCGIRRLIVPFSSLLVICSSSMAAVACSMFLGERVVELLFLDHLALTGGIVLVLLGLYVFYQYRQESKSAKKTVNNWPGGKAAVLTGYLPWSGGPSRPTWTIQGC